MAAQYVEIRKSPILFLKRLIGVEFFFALLPFAVLALPNIRSEYESSQVGGALSYNLLLAIAMTTLQVLILVAVFSSWYVPVYQIGETAVLYKRGDLLGDRKLADTYAISDIEVRQGWLSRRLDYGTLIIRCSTLTNKSLIRDIPNPGFHAQLIQGLLVSETALRPEFEPEGVNEIIAGGENQYVEFKSSLIWDYRRQSANKDLYEPVMKTITGFLNSRGGVVIVGVDDAGQVLGLDPDLSTLGKANVDGFENAFNMAFNKMIGVEFRRYVEVAFPQVGRDTVCMISVRSADEPAYLTNKGAEWFYIRAGNATQPLSVSKATRYIQARFN
jgi:membrane protein YdbS with pleckstrin-like domain